MDTGDDRELLARAVGGSAEAFETLLTPHLPMLLAYSRAICGDFHAAQDAVQETALVAFRNLHHLFPEVDFATWLRAIARRQALAARRKLTRLSLVAEEILEMAYLDLEPAAEATRQEALSECLGRLGGRMGDVVRAHYFDGRRLADMAATWKMNVAAVKQLLYRSRLWLRDCVDRRLASEKVS